VALKVFLHVFNEIFSERFFKHESPAVAKEDALQLHLLQYWPSTSRSSKVHDFHFIQKSVCHFLLVICSNVGPSLTVSEI